MPIARSGGPIIYSEFVAETRAAFVAAVLDRLKWAGWVLYSTVAGGEVLLGTSPQSGGANNLTVRVKVADTGAVSLIGNPQASIQIISDVDPTIVSTERHAKTVTGSTYRIHANRCQFFIWRPGVADDVYGSMIAGGVPYVAPNTACEGIVPGMDVSEAWWIASDDVNVGSSVSHPRTNLMGGGPTHSPQPPNRAEACWNGDFHGISSPGQWQILPIKGLQSWAFFASFGITLSRTLWADGSGLQIEPLLSWGLAADTLGRIRAQLWDAWLTTNQCAMDSTFTDTLGDAYLNFTDEYYWGCLQLLLGTDTAPDTLGIPNIVY